MQPRQVKAQLGRSREKTHDGIETTRHVGKFLGEGGSRLHNSDTDPLIVGKLLLEVITHSR